MFLIRNKLAIVKKSALTSLVALGCAAAAPAMAASIESYDIQLSASIPDDSFHVRPVNGGWINNVQDMHWDSVSEKLTDFTELFQYKNTAGAIQATITNANTSGNAQLTNGVNIIPLTVTFNGVVVENSATEVVSSAQGISGGRANLVISAGNNTYPANVEGNSGEYTGSVALVFEPKP